MVRLISSVLSLLLLLMTKTNSYNLSNASDSFFYDDSIPKELLSKMQLLQVSNDNLRLNLDNIKISWKEEATSLKMLLMEQKAQTVTALNTMQRELKEAFSVCQNALIDVRSNFETSTQSCPTLPATPIAPITQHASCAAALKAGSKSGIYELFIRASALPAFNAYCLEDPKGGAAWTVIQRRQDGSINFARDWEAFKQGFGFLEAEFFLGLEKIHALTQSEQHELWIHMEDFEGGARDAKYKVFAIDNERSKYALNSLGAYEGDAGDSLRYHFGQKFSTLDADNDEYNKNCAVEFTGAWWHKACHESNLNGQYLRGAHPNVNFAKGVVWKAWHEYYYSLKYVHMAIRPIH